LRQRLPDGDCRQRESDPHAAQRRDLAGRACFRRTAQKTFDATADGFGRKGCVLLVLQRYSDALAAGDQVLSLVRGSAVNQDGPSSGLTAPNGPAQESVIRQALTRAGLAPGDVDYVEAHGTGTSLGDPIEVQALAGVFGSSRADGDPLLVGSVKTNLGHVEAAAGVTGLLKLALSLQHQQIPPHLHLTKLNPHVAWDEMRSRTALTDWAKRPGANRQRRLFRFQQCQRARDS
jgi:acyl transferase domain-containing protein